MEPKSNRRVFIWSGAILAVAVVIGVVVGAAGGTPTKSAVATLLANVPAPEWTEGNATATVSLVEYGDFECPACAAYEPLVNRLVKEFGGEISFSFRHFPLAQHPNAIPAAYAAEAAGNQGKFWEMYDMIYTHQNDWATSATAKDIFKGYAQSLGLDMAKFESDLSSDAVAAKVEADRQSGVASHVEWTPTFFLNGTRIDQNPQSYDAFKAMIDEALTSAASAKK